MTLKSKIIYLRKETGFANLVTFTLQSDFNFDVVSFTENEEVYEYLDKTEDFYLFICDGSISLGNAQECFSKFCEKKMNVPYFIVGSDDYISKFKDMGPDLFHRSKFLDEARVKLESYFMQNPLVKVEEYCEVDFKTLSVFDHLQCDVFIKMKSGRFLKIFKEEDAIEQDDIDKYAKKGVHTLFLHKSTAHWILKQIQMNFSSFVDALDRGEQIKVINPNISPAATESRKQDGSCIDEVEETTKKQESCLDEEKPDSEKSFSELIAEIKNEKEALRSKELEQSVDENLGISSDLNSDIQLKVSKALKIMSKNKKAKKRLEKLKVDRNPDQYFKIHVNLLCKITCAIAQVMDWNNDSTLEKLIFVSYMHDITLVDHPHLARIRDLAHFDTLEDSLSEEEQKLFLDHPKEIKKMVLESDESPVDSEKIIYQHHEMASGKGFPSKLQTNRILPLSCLFIVAHDLVDYIIENPKWKLDEYISSNCGKFTGAGFSKIIKKLPELKS
ncbi:hypothetical protein A9Q84_12670 [Halobacteriovorax marinus]|mgnify:CR=1 FL=1|uniref:HD-GYP domain-containing protein n=1 Tax=Halobacteriovorax marinus TaxID=97084 RepID=A0A1Y5F8H0_9BACT|nr:hypothetical protein A9Q84_12670 [Halobacteriovorax marinus]